MGEIELLFLGTGTSAGIPMIGCHCAVCTSSDPRDRRMRTSAVVSYGGVRVLIDASPELRLQCVANGIERIDAIVCTHAHADHIMGLDDVRRFNAILGRPIDVWSEPPTQEILSRCFGYAFTAPSAEVKVFRPHLVHRAVNGPFDIGPMHWTPIRLIHGDVLALGFRIGRLAYCTDVSRLPEESFELLRDLDVLVLDGLQHKKHPTHFSVAEAVDAAQRIGAKQTWLTHIAHGLAHAKTNRELPPSIQLAYDGQLVRSRE